MATVQSQDGTQIAFDQTGNGPALILVGGFPDRSSNAHLAALLSANFTVYNYDRRGRGVSGDTQPYSLDRDYEDLAALIDQAGGSVLMFGTSGGGVMALEAAARGLPITQLAVWEPPYITDNSRPPVPADYQQRLSDMRDAGRLGDMVEFFMTVVVGMPAEFVAPMRSTPFWPAMEAGAGALVYDAAVTGDFSLPTERIAQVNIPTLVIDGGFTPWMSHSAEVLAATLPHAERRTLAGQPHNVDATVIATVLVEFFGR